jgi:hypothetical protein
MIASRCLNVLDHDLVLPIRDGNHRCGIGSIPIVDFARGLAVIRKELVVQDGDEPSLKGGASLELLLLADGSQHRLLHEVLSPGLGSVAHRVFHATDSILRLAFRPLGSPFGLGLLSPVTVPIASLTELLVFFALPATRSLSMMASGLG